MPVSRRLAILNDFQGAALQFADWEAIRGLFSIDHFQEMLPEGDRRAGALEPYEVIVAMRERTPFPSELLQRLPHLKLLVTTGMWNRAIDMQAATRQGITVCGTDSSRQAPVELAWALILGVSRHIAQEDAAMRGGSWQTRVGVELHGKTLGVLGLGRLGSEMVRIGRAFGMEPIVWSQNLTAAKAAEAGAALVSKEGLFRRSDIITIQLVLSDRTRGLIGEAELRSMKPTAMLVNTSRGPIVDEDALVTALTEGWIGGAALDVYEVEPLPRDHRLRRAPRTLLTPHIGITTDVNYRIYYTQAVEDVLAWLAGEPLRVLNGSRSAASAQAPSRR